MKKTLLRRLALLVVLCLALMQLPFAIAEDGAVVVEISKHGNLALSITGAEFAAMGYACGDIISVEIIGKSFEMPVGSSYSDVDNGQPVCRISSPEANLVIALNMGDFATSAGVASKTAIEEEPGYRWELCEGVQDPVSVSISMKEAGGYYDQWLLRQLVRSNERTDYPQLSDAEFANFREISTSGMKPGMLYRSSSPVNPELGRHEYAEAAMEQAGVAAVINLADGAISYEGWNDGYYAGCEIICLNMAVDYTGGSYREGFARAMRFIIENEGPFLLHCNEGKDRAGFFSAVLECFMGADAEEVAADYMLSYVNYYGVEPGSEQYAAIAQSNIEKILSTAFGIEDIYNADLSAEAAEYMAESGLSDEEIAALHAKLAL